jgi:hypothetical protein
VPKPFWIPAVALESQTADRPFGEKFAPKAVLNKMRIKKKTFQFTSPETIAKVAFNW